MALGPDQRRGRLGQGRSPQSPSIWYGPQSGPRQGATLPGEYGDTQDQVAGWAEPGFFGDSPIADPVVWWTELPPDAPPVTVADPDTQRLAGHGTKSPRGIPMSNAEGVQQGWIASQECSEGALGPLAALVSPFSAAEST